MLTKRSLQVELTTGLTLIELELTNRSFLDQHG